MLGRLKTATKYVGDKIGWSWLGVVLSLAIIATAGVVLYRILHNLNFQDVLKALKTFDHRDTAIAAAFVAAGYITLTFYDLFALRTIGKEKVPYRIAALAGFTSYSIGHNIGASVFTGGAVRYRIYSLHGLSAVDVAKLCFIAGLTFWLGNVTVLGLGILYTPHAAGQLNHLPEWFNRTVAVGALLVLASYIVWVWRVPRQVGRSNWKVTLPNGPMTLLQIGIGIIDLGCCAFAMYMLMPAEPYISLIELSVIFVAATLLGFASHSPGGLGVFDAAMLTALWQYNQADLIAGLLLFRLLYYITPFALALVLLGVREAWLSVTKQRRPIVTLPADKPLEMTQEKMHDGPVS
jgi:uncharacterized membrane protein YbhN (UPF0104 family)